MFFGFVVKKRSKLKQIVPKHLFSPRHGHRMGKHSSRSSERQRIFYTTDKNDTHFTNPRTWAVMWDSKIQIRDRDQVKGHDSSQTIKHYRLLFTAMIFSVMVLAIVACCEAAEKNLILQTPLSKLTQKPLHLPPKGPKTLSWKPPVQTLLWPTNLQERRAIEMTGKHHSFAKMQRGKQMKAPRVPVLQWNNDSTTSCTSHSKDKS